MENKQTLQEKARRILKVFAVFIIVFTWIFSGWPQVWQNPGFPPKIRKAQAALTYVGGVVGSRAGSTSAGQALSLTTLTGGSGSAAIAGDIVIVACSTGSAADRAVGVSSPTDYTELTELYSNETSYDTNLSVSWKIMGGTPDTSVTCAPSGSTADALSGIAYVWRGIDSGTPFDVTLATTTGLNTGRPTPPAIQPTTSGTIIIAIGAGAAIAGANYTTATLSNFQTTTGADTNDSMLGMGSYAWSSGTYTPAQFGGGTTGTADSWAAATLALRPAPAIVAPTVTTQAASSVEDTTATCNGNITATGGANATARGCEWDTDSGAPYANSASDTGDFGAVSFTKALTSLPAGTTIYARAFGTNSAGTGYGSEVSFLTKPAAPTNVAATDGTYTDKVTITWTKPTGATNYHVWRDTTDLGAAGDVATFDDTGADAPTITAGSAVASDGTSNAQVDLSLSGSSANNGTTHTYKVVASNATGNSADSATNTGYRGVGSLTYQWQRSSGDSDASYSNIDGATSSTYGDTAAPTPTVMAGTASATDGSATDKVTLSISGASANNGAGRYYKAVLNATGASGQTSVSNRGYRGVGSLTYQWYRSSGDADSGYATLSGATTAPYDDTTSPAPAITAGSASASDGTTTAHVALSISGQSANNGAGRYFYATVGASGAASADTNHDRGYIGVGSLTYQWQRSSGDSDAGYSNIAGATTANYNDTGAPADGSGRYYKAVLNATGATQAISAVNRGYKAIASISLATGGSVAFGFLADNTVTTTPISQIQTVNVDGGPVDLDIKSTVFSDGSNTWALGASNGINQVKWEFSKDGTNWTTFSTADSYYTFDTGVSQGQTRDVYFRLTMPSSTGHYSQFGSTITILATAP